MSEARPSFLRRRWRGIVAGLAVLAAALGALAWRAHRQYQVDLAFLATEVAALREAGMPVTLSELEPPDPPLDSVRQAEFEAALADCRPFEVVEATYEENDELLRFVVGLRSEPPAAIVAAFEATAPVADRARESLEAGGVGLGPRAFLDRLPPDHATDVEVAVRVGLESLGDAKSLALEAADRALVGDEPAPWIAVLDGLLELRSMPASDSGALLWVWEVRYRDETLVSLACRGTLPAEDRRRWFHAPVDPYPVILEGLRVDAVLQTGPNAMGILEDRITRPGSDRLRDALADLGLVPPDTETISEVATRPRTVADWMNEQRTRYLAMEALQGAWSIPSVETPVEDSLRRFVRSVAHQRLARAAVAALEFRRKHGAFPDDADLAAGRADELRLFLSATPRTPRLRYERRGPSSLRLHVPVDEGPPGWQRLMADQAEKDRKLSEDSDADRPLKMEWTFIEIELAPGE